MKKLFPLFVVAICASISYLYFAKLVPGLAKSHLEPNHKALNYQEISVHKWPWFGLRLKQANYKSTTFSWRAPSLDLEIALKPAFFSKHYISKISMKNPEFIFKGDLEKWRNGLKINLLPETIGLPEMSFYENFKISIQNASFRVNKLSLDHVSINTTTIQNNVPFTLTIQGDWQQHPFKFSALMTKSAQGIRLDNTHLTIEHLSKAFGMSYIKINSDLLVNNHNLTLSNLAIMTPEVRAQGQAKINLSDLGNSSGFLEMPGAPCRNILNNLNLVLDTKKSFLKNCSGKIKWQAKKLDIMLDSDDLSANAKLNLANAGDPQSELNLKAGNINSLFSKNKSKIVLNKLLTHWFNKIVWGKPKLGRMLMEQVTCNKVNNTFVCNANITQKAHFKVNLKDFDSGTVRLTNITPAMAFSVIGSNLSNILTGEFNGKLSWHRNLSTLIYKGSISSPELTLIDWHLRDYLANKEITDKIVKVNGKIEKWSGLSIIFSGLNDILNFNKVTADDFYANGIVDLGSGALSIDLKAKERQFNLLGKWPDEIYLLRLLPGTDLNRRPSD